MRVESRRVPGRRRNQQAELTVVFKQNASEKQAFIVRKSKLFEPSMLIDPLIQVKITDAHRKPQGLVIARWPFMLLL